MPSTIYRLIVASSLALPLCAQGSLVKFDEGCGTRTMGFHGGGLLPIQNTLATPLWTTGRFGSALRGSDGIHRGDRYLNAPVSSWSGDFTLGIWLRERYAHRPGNGRRVLAGAIHMSLTRAGATTIGNLQFVFSDPNGGNNYVRLDQDVWALTAAAWTHVALVYDEASLTATIYLDGQPVAPITVTAPLRPRWGPALIGYPGFPPYHDIDECYFEQRALSAGEMLALATQPQAGVGWIRSNCNDLSLRAIGNELPTIGSTNFGIRTTAPSGYLIAIGFGTSVCSLNGLPLPYDLGNLYPNLAGCQIVANQNLGVFPATVGSSGYVDVPLSIPTNAAPMVFFSQVFGLDANAQPGGSNGLGIAVGY